MSPLVRNLYRARTLVHVLLIDRNHALAEVLESAGFKVVTMSSLDDLTPPEELARFDGVALGKQGTVDERNDLCRQLRRRGYTGFIVATCGDAVEGESALDAGADDFAAYDARELLTRVRACIRRTGTHSRLRWGPPGPRPSPPRPASPRPDHRPHRA